MGVLALPVLFAAGMTLLDTLDGALMARLYRSARRTARDRQPADCALPALQA